jgi:16S rRNA processing protein RimM
VTKKASTFKLSSSTEAGISGPASEPIQVGYVRRAHGIKGAVIVRSLTDDPDRLAVGAAFATDSTEFPTLTITSIQPHKDGALVTLAGLVDRNTAERLRGVSLLIAPTDRRELGADEFWPEQLIGLVAVDARGEELGTVVDVVEGGAQDRLKVEGRAGSFEVPFVAALIPEINIAVGRIVIDPPEGLVDAQ